MMRRHRRCVTLQDFFSLTPERVLEAVEEAGERTTGMCYALNSLENRVYEVELEDGSRRIAKFYRPGRWDEATILDEHRLLGALAQEEIPVAAPLKFKDGRTLWKSGEGIWVALFPRVGGRAPDDLGKSELEQLGRVLGRIHNIAAKLRLTHRPSLSPKTYGHDSLNSILQRGRMSDSLAARYDDAARRLIGQAEQRWPKSELHVIHADFHRGNILNNSGGWLVLDFDDAAVAPAAQDFWLVLPGRPAECPEEVDALVRGYEQFRAFDSSTLSLIEVLRGLRYLRYAAWIAVRWDDPSFQRAFPDFGSERYWESQIADLHEQLELVSRGDESQPRYND